jgi:hypothetical protein
LLDTVVEKVRLGHDSPDFADNTGSGQCRDIALDTVSVAKDGGIFSKASESYRPDIAHKVFIILAPMSISLTVSTKVELTIPGCGFKDSSTTRPGISCGIQIRLSSCSSTVGKGVLREETRSFSQPLEVDPIDMFPTHVHSGTYTGRPIYGAHRPS